MRVRDDDITPHKISKSEASTKKRERDRERLTRVQSREGKKP